MLKNLMLMGIILVSPVCLQASEFGLASSLVEITRGDDRLDQTIINLSVVAGGCVVLATGWCLYKYRSRFNCWRRRRERQQEDTPTSYGAIED